jgi:hypothetical protein
MYSVLGFAGLQIGFGSYKYTITWSFISKLGKYNKLFCVQRVHSPQIRLCCSCFATMCFGKAVRLVVSSFKVLSSYSGVTFVTSARLSMLMLSASQPWSSIPQARQGTGLLVLIGARLHGWIDVVIGRSV